MITEKVKDLFLLFISAHVILAPAWPNQGSAVRGLWGVEPLPEPTTCQLLPSWFACRTPSVLQFTWDPRKMCLAKTLSKHLSENSDKSDNVNSICMSEHVFLNLTKDSTRVGLELKLHAVIHLK